ncbi:protein phosphatase 1 regulatory subunit 21 [Thrips palmi]|uniref:Protein phosphatase 1 regulatory subunit 21 n=1 Tax=Thrips palmi TaxID=161013 RepID=A0A6P8YME4_THRPL|nr:protein phosphatase 1 regulatory subunit 21 [Thrips palmi]XP_034238306.1 protein phosphatase 1 regulatory subunit 21 [Thrips palmi]
MDGIGGDLQTKYQKVASEYSKVRAQVAVLKKAVLDEQTKNSDLRDMLKEREQSLRKAEQEMDSLSFRNQQLTKRVTVLQDELDSMSKAKKSKTKQPATNSACSNEVMGEELHKSITENAKLLSLLHDKEESHSQDIEHLNQRIEQLEHELRTQQEQHKRAVSKLEMEKASALGAASLPAPAGTPSYSVSNRLDQRVEALQKSNVELTAHAREMNSQRLQLTSQLEDATRIIRTHLPFVDSSDRDLNELNVPHHDRSQQAHVLRIVNQAGSYLEELAGALEKYHSHVRNRLLLVHSSLSPLNSKFSEHLQDSGRQLHHLRQGYSDFQQGLECDSWTLDTAPSLSAFSGPLRSYSAYLQKLQPYCQLSVEEECILFGASEEILTASRDVVSCSAYLSVQVSKICGYVHLLAGQNRRHSQHPVQSQQRFMKELVQALKVFHQAVQELLCSYTVKFALERESGNAMISTAQEDADGILSTLASAVISSGKIVEVLDGYQMSLSGSSLNGKQVHPTVTAFRKRAANYLSSLEQDEPPSIPYEDALNVQVEVRSKTASLKALMSQLQNMQELAAQVEQDREHWKEEYHLLHLHHEPHESNKKNLVSTSTSENNDGESAVSVVTNLLGKHTTPFITPAEIEAREEQVKNYFRTRLYEHVARWQTSEAKATTYMSECAVLKTRLEDAVESRKACEERASKLSEELASTTQTFDSQLAVMTEHLANMNEKLALQKDTIDHLKFQSKTKKGKQK